MHLACSEVDGMIKMRMKNPGFDASHFLRSYLGETVGKIGKEGCMKQLLRIEELSFFGLSILLFYRTGNSWWWFLLLLFIPDAGMAGYLINTKIGAVLYNVVHHRAVGVLLYGAGFMTGIIPL